MVQKMRCFVPTPPIDHPCTRVGLNVEAGGRAPLEGQAATVVYLAIVVTLRSKDSSHLDSTGSATEGKCPRGGSTPQAKVGDRVRRSRQPDSDSVGKRHRM